MQKGPPKRIPHFTRVDKLEDQLSLFLCVTSHRDRQRAKAWEVPRLGDRQMWGFLLRLVVIRQPLGGSMKCQQYRKDNGGVAPGKASYWRRVRLWESNQTGGPMLGSLCKPPITR
ncbi:hypothetical protein C4D60_Mb00t19670 [Musa balbisiana]|uniref:Uncharacterized protein n=1 Tax=Musa balbisiana TaxID=52838 RepID=A0A4S8I3E7_MUSBA|nr:hypothetical protein C4D60_Mb00t19670 [Musa balbisiana]